MWFIDFSIYICCLNVALVSTLGSDNKEMAQMFNSGRRPEMIRRVQRWDSHDSNGDRDRRNGPACDLAYLCGNPSSIPKDITIVSPSDAAPFISQYGNNPPTGLDVDLFKQISKLTQINFHYQYYQFTQLIPIVQNNSNIISAGFQTDTIAREAFVNFVDFFRYKNGFIVRSDYTATVNGLSDLCDKTVVVLINSIQANDVQQQNIICGATHPINIIIVTNITDLVNAVASGSANVGVFLDPVLEYSASHSNGQLKTVGVPYNLTTAGFLCNKGNQPLCCLLVNAINYLIKAGTYEQLLNKYSFTYQANGVCPSRLNLNGTTCSSACVPSSSFCQNKLNPPNNYY